MGKLVYLRPEKIIYDTSVYISYLRSGKHRGLADQVENAVFYLHSTVFEELLAGIRTQKEQRELLNFKKPFVEKNRILTPTDQDWEETGLIINQLTVGQKVEFKNLVGLTHDILIALSVRRIGARVITENGKDFEKIRKIKDFKLTVWPSKG